MNKPAEIKMPDFCDRHRPIHFLTALHVLKKIGHNLNNIRITAVGEFENYRGEIREQKPKPGTVISSDTGIELHIGYPSAVDKMPYQFFYGLAGLTERVSDWENNARGLMAPFDAAFIRKLAEADYELLRFNQNFLDDEHTRRYQELYEFGNLDLSDPEDTIRWLALMPAFHFWAGNAELVGHALEYLFGYKFKIVENAPAQYDIPVEHYYRLGSKRDRLGGGTIMGKSFVEFDSAYEVVIEDVDSDIVRDFLPGQPMRTRIESVLNFFMPGNLDFRIKVKTKPDNTKLGNKEKKGYLGYNTYL
jgi:hypothetical protein